MKTILAFDAASSVASCALVVDGEAIGETTAEARSILLAANGLLVEAGLTPAALDAIVVGTGPGSFTSTRIALATARGLALAVGIPVAGGSTFGAFAGGLPVIDARRGEVFVPGPAVMTPEELDCAGSVLIGDGAVRYRDIFERAGAEVPSDDDARHLPQAALLVAHAATFGPAGEIEPVYVRAPDAKVSA